MGIRRSPDQCPYLSDYFRSRQTRRVAAVDGSAGRRAASLGVMYLQFYWLIARLATYPVASNADTSFPTLRRGPEEVAASRARTRSSWTAGIGRITTITTAQSPGAWTRIGQWDISWTGTGRLTALTVHQTGSAPPATAYAQRDTAAALLSLLKLDPDIGQKQSRTVASILRNVSQRDIEDSSPSSAPRNPFYTR